MFNKKNKLNLGFSLVELLVVITIIAILSVTAYIAFGGQTSKARNTKRIESLGTIQSALEIYAVSHENKYPAGDITALATELNAVGLMKELPVDPGSTPNDFVYVASGSQKSYLLVATLEDETGGEALKAHVIGNGDETTLLAGIGYDASSGTCSATAGCDITDQGSCVPYCL